MTTSALGFAPSNIAILKYMGQVDPLTKTAANPSISMTLGELGTYFEISFRPGPEPLCVQWLSESETESLARSLEVRERFPHPVSRDARARMEAFLLRAARELGVGGARRTELTSGTCTVGTINTFPFGAGIASSASSFAAATVAMAGIVFPEASSKMRDVEFVKTLARFSQTGSGSSCRSFFGPWCEWVPSDSKNPVRPRQSGIEPLVDIVCLVDSSPKEVSSSEAHRRVVQSPLYKERQIQIGERFVTMGLALDQGDVLGLKSLVWKEFMEMHELFHTAVPPWSYLKPETRELLAWLEPWVQDSHTPILVTLDAGPNIHVLVPSGQAETWKQRILSQFSEVRVCVSAPANASPISVRLNLR